MPAGWPKPSYVHRHFVYTMYFTTHQVAWLQSLTEPTSNVVSRQQPETEPEREISGPEGRQQTNVRRSAADTVSPRLPFTGDIYDRTNFLKRHVSFHCNLSCLTKTASLVGLQRLALENRKSFFFPLFVSLYLVPSNQGHFPRVSTPSLLAIPPCHCFVYLKFVQCVILENKITTMQTV